MTIKDQHSMKLVLEALLLLNNSTDLSHKDTQVAQNLISKLLNEVKL